MGLQAGYLLAFGIDTPKKSYGLVQRYEIDDTVNRALERAPDGAVVGIQEFHDTKTLNLNYIALSAGSSDEPVIGTSFIFADSTWQLDSVRESNIVDGWQSYDITAQFYPDIH